MHGQQRRPPWLVAIAGALIVVVADLVSGAFFRTATRATTVLTVATGQGPDPCTLVVFPGIAASGRAVRDAFTPHLGPGRSLVVVCYAQRGVDDDQIHGLVLDALRSLPEGRLEILGGSLGGLVAARFLQRYAATPASVETHGRATLFLDTAPSDAAAVRLPRLLFRLARRYRGGVLSSVLWAAVVPFAAKPEPEIGADPGAIRAGERHQRWLGVPTLTSHADYVATFDLSSVPDLRSAVGEAVYLHAADAEHDPLVDVRTSVARWSSVLPHLAVHAVVGRRGEWHLPWVYRPREVLTALGSAGR